MKNERTISILRRLTGIAVPVVLWATIFYCAKIIGLYSHMSRMVSELGELGTITARIFTSGLVACAVLSLFFISTLFYSGKRHNISSWPMLILLTFLFSIGCAGIFPYPTALHGTFGSPSIFLFLSPILATLLWPSIVRPRGIIPFGFLALFFMLSGFSTFFPYLFPGAIGLKQRAFHFGWSIWVIYLGIAFYSIAQTTILPGRSQHA